MIKRFSLDKIKYYVMVWVFFFPGLFSWGSTFGIIQQFDSYAVYALSVVAIIAYFYYNKFRFHCNKAYIMLALLSIPMAVSTVVDTGKISSLFVPAYFKLFAWMLWTDLMIQRGCFAKMLHAMSNSFIAMILINLVGIIALPNGFIIELTVDGGYWQQWTPIYFIGNDNTFALQFVFYLGIIAIADYLDNGHISFRTIISVLMCDISVLLVWTGSGVVACLGLTVVLLLAYRNILKQKLLNYKVLIPVYVALFILIVWNQNTGFLSFAVKDILHKDVTLSGRTLIWSEYISLIMDKPFLGHGIAISEYIQFGGRTRSTHNNILQILLYGGFVSLFGYFSLIWIALKKQYDNRREMMGTVFTWLILIILICFMVEQNVFYLGQYVLMYILFVGEYGNQEVKIKN